mmetsp:Transcript_106486/g.306095  ORF Transcript_106486/g.306095 Transcript_106486/m.306095 type:complete len:302 (-) Transcript_106486:567-1472(-)
MHRGELLQVYAHERAEVLGAVGGDRLDRGGNCLASLCTRRGRLALSISLHRHDELGLLRGTRVAGAVLFRVFSWPAGQGRRARRRRGRGLGGASVGVVPYSGPHSLLALERRHGHERQQPGVEGMLAVHERELVRIVGDVGILQVVANLLQGEVAPHRQEGEGEAQDRLHQPSIHDEGDREHVGPQEEMEQILVREGERRVRDLRGLTETDEAVGNNLVQAAQNRRRCHAHVAGLMLLARDEPPHDPTFDHGDARLGWDRLPAAVRLEGVALLRPQVANDGQGLCAVDLFVLRPLVPGHRH